MQESRSVNQTIQQPVDTIQPEAAPPAGTVDYMMLPKFDYTELPLEQAVGAFRSLGREILFDLLLEQQMSDLVALLRKGQTKFTTPRLVWPKLLHRYTAYGRQALVDDLRLMVDNSFRHIRQRRWQASVQAFRQIPPRLITIRQLNRLEHALGNVSAETIPDDLFALIAETAWADLRFQHEIATKLRSHLRQSELFAQGDKALVLLSPYTLWVLLALAPLSAAFSLDWLTREYWFYRWAAQRLQRVATQYVLTAAGWAGFWDQWVIWRAMTQRPDAIVLLHPTLYNGLMALPIFQFTGATKRWSSPNEQTATVGPQLDPAANFAAPAWAATMPGWFRIKYVHALPQDGR